MRHADVCHTPFTSPSGNIGSNTLATALHIDNLECKVNEVDEETLAFWNKLKQTGSEEAKIKPEDLVYIAEIDTEEQEDAVLNRLGIKNYEVADVHTEVAAIMAEIDQKLKDCDMIYVSFDVDLMIRPDLTRNRNPIKGLTRKKPKQSCFIWLKMRKRFVWKSWR